MNKFFHAVIILAILIVSAYFSFQYLEKRAEKKDRIEKRRQELEEMRKAEEIEVQRRKEEERQHEAEIARQRAEREKLASERSQPIHPLPNPPRSVSLPTGVATKIQAVDRRPTIEAICRDAHCRLIRYEVKGEHAYYIMVEGPDHNSVSDILDPLIRAGMVNFTEDKGKFGVRLVKGERVYTAAYTLRW